MTKGEIKDHTHFDCAECTERQKKGAQVTLGAHSVF